MPWIERHRARLVRDLADSETLLGAHRVLLTSVEMASALELDASPADGPAHLRYGQAARPMGRAMGRRLGRARELGFEVPGAIFVLGLSNQRVLLWRASAGLARPAALTTTIPLREIAAIRSARRFGRERLAVLRDDHAMLVVAPLWGRGLDRLAAAFTTATGTT
jgi:hypothetical protein